MDSVEMDKEGLRNDNPVACGTEVITALAEWTCPRNTSGSVHAKETLFARQFAWF